MLCRQEEFEDTKGLIRIRISKKNRQITSNIVYNWTILADIS
jgi:hypothetical protein